MNDLPERGIDILTGQPVRGKLLGELLQAGPLAPERVLRYAISIGKALSRAHDRGLVHGNLSPWSIVVGEHTAAILRPVAQDARALAYTSPEQIRGQAPDWRSDTFAYGAVLYEMAAGRPAFAGAPSAVRTAILEQSAPELPAGSPVLAAIGPVIADCLNKEPQRRRQRLQNVVTDLKLAARFLTGAAHPRARRAVPAAGAGQKAAPAAPAADRYWLDVFAAEQAARRAKLMRLLGFVAILLTVAAAGLFAGRLLFSRHVALPVMKFLIPLEAKSSAPVCATLSPDGRYIAFTADGPNGHRMLWLRALDEMHARLILGTDGASEPFWSPDSSGIGYFADRSLKIWKLQMAADGTVGAPQVLCPADNTAGGGTWNAAGVIVFAPSLDGGLYRISAGGGDLQIQLPLNSVKEHRSYRWPHFLPDGRHFTFLALGAADKANGVYSGDLQTRDIDMLFVSDSDALYAGDLEGNPAKFGYLLFIHDGDLYTQGFNPSILEVQGKPELFLGKVDAIETLSLAPLSVSSTGLMVYQTVSPPARQLVWMDREGKQVAVLGEPGEWGLPRIAPDGRRVVCSKVAPDRQKGDLWLFDGDAMSRLVSIPGTDARTPVWSPDGARVAFTGNPGTLYDIYLRTTRAADPAELLFHSEYSKYLTDWSRDGRFLLFGSFETAGTASDVWAFSLGDRRGGPVIDAAHAESYPALSPDGRWLAYQSSESGREEISVRPFEGITTGGKRRWQITGSGGRMPRWRGDGKELFFLAGPGSVMSAAASSDGGDFKFEPPRQLFETRAIPKKSNLYDVSPDGQRFLMNLPYEWPGDSPITVMTNWMQERRNP